MATSQSPIIAEDLPFNGKECGVAAFTVAAAIENRAKEIGLAVLDVHKYKLTLTQLIEPSRTYATFLMVLEAHQPKRLVVVVDKTSAVRFGLNHATRCYSQVSRQLYEGNKSLFFNAG